MTLQLTHYIKISFHAGYIQISSVESNDVNTIRHLIMACIDV